MLANMDHFFQQNPQLFLTGFGTICLLLFATIVILVRVEIKRRRRAAAEAARPKPRQYGGTSRNVYIQDEFGEIVYVGMEDG